MSEIKNEIKEKTKAMEDICEKLVKTLSVHLESGIQEADTEETGKVVDMIKDLCEAKEKCVKAMYHCQIMEAMEDSEGYGKDWDEEGPLRGYRGRSARTGRYVHRAYSEGRDMDRNDGRMYYTVEPAHDNASAYRDMRMYEERMNPGRMYSDGSIEWQKAYNRGYTDGKMSSSTRYDMARKGYEEAEDHTEKREKLQQLMDALEQDLMPYAPTMDANDKQIVKNGLQKMINRFN